MQTLITRLNITLPTQLALELKRTVPKRKRSYVIAEALSEKLAAFKRKKALRDLAGIWDQSGGVSFSTDRELAIWRKSLWSSFDKRLIQK